MSELASSYPFEKVGFSVQNRDGQARAGVLELTHGKVETPIFMPVGTLGTVKGVLPEELVKASAQIILGNAYHLYLQPGLDVLRTHGGLHNMMNWNRPILTDSGGYQVFSLKDLRKIHEDGVRFRDHRAGAYHMFTPELVIEIQETIGSDIMMVFDECPDLTSGRAYLEQSIARTTRWALRCLKARTRPDCALFAITQGGVDLDLRRAHIEELAPYPFDGFAIGGLSVGEAKERMYETVEVAAPLLPADRPRYLMGVGTPQDLLECIWRGVDMFDCVMPTRNARNGQLFTSRGKVIVKHARYKKDTKPADEECACYTCQHYSRSYLRHLFTNKEMLAGHLMTLHNIHYYLHLVAGARSAIQKGRLEAYIKNVKEGWEREV